ncbi:MAG: hypothetical protein WC365_08560, partial [Candidatus Babeliales bacterium]
MQKAPQKPEKSSQNVKIPDKLAKKGSTKEILVLISENQQKQAETLGKLEVTVGKLEQRVDDYICNHDRAESKKETSEQHSQSNVKWIIGT